MNQFPPKKHLGFRAATMMLLGHMAGSAIIFSAFALVAWGLGFGVHFLHTKHPFPDEVLHVLHNVELWMLYADIGLSSIVLIVGAYRFIKEIGGVE